MYELIWFVAGAGTVTIFFVGLIFRDYQKTCREVEAMQRKGK